MHFHSRQDKFIFQPFLKWSKLGNWDIDFWIFRHHFYIMRKNFQKFERGWNAAEKFWIGNNESMKLQNQSNLMNWSFNIVCYHEISLNWLKTTVCETDFIPLLSTSIYINGSLFSLWLEHWKQYSKHKTNFQI